MKQYGIEGIAGILGLVLAIFIFVATIPTVGTAQVAAVGNGSGIAGYGNANITGAAASMTGLFTLLWVAIGLVLFSKFV